MRQQREYKRGIFDRSGPDRGAWLKAGGLGFMVTGMSYMGASLEGLGGPMTRPLICLSFGAVASAFSLFLSESAGAAYQHLMVDGSSTPYKEQYSYQQALVMQGRIDDALESFEAVIAENPGTLDARVKAAELYAREKKNAVRAAQLFREIQQLPTVSPGEYIYATNRLCDLLTGPLKDRGRALVELRRLIEKYPGTTAAEHARTALAALKPVHHDS